MPIEASYQYADKHEADLIETDDDHGLDASLDEMLWITQVAAS